MHLDNIWLPWLLPTIIELLMGALDKNESIISFDVAKLIGPIYCQCHLNNGPIHINFSPNSAVTRKITLKSAANFNAIQKSTDNNKI